MVYEGISFRDDIASVYTLDQFLSQYSTRKLWAGINEEVKMARLKEFYQLCELLKIYTKQV